MAELTEGKPASLVVYDVEYEPLDSDFDEELALMQVFGMTGDVQIRSPSELRYRAGEYDLLEGVNPEAWSGVLTVTRSTKIPVWTTGSDGRNRLESLEAGPAAFEAIIPVVYVPSRHILITVERPHLEHTKVAHFAVQASKKSPRPFQLRLRLQWERLGIYEAVRSFEVIRKVNVSFRHSQSPGVDGVDDEIDETGAAKMTISATEKAGHGLSKDNLLEPDPQTFLAKVFRHIALNPKNGKITIAAEQHGRPVNFRSDKAAEMPKITLPTDQKEAARLLVERVVPPQPPDSEDEEDPQRTV